MWYIHFVALNKGEYMITKMNIEEYLWMLTVVFATFLFLGSFVVSRDLYDLAYLVTLYIFIILGKVIKE